MKSVGVPGGMVKATIVSQLGEGELLLPGQVNEALAANDRAKYFMSLLQAAREHADYHEAPFTDLRPERVACGVTDANLDSVVSHSRRVDAAEYLIPGACHLHDCLVKEIQRMIAPLRSVAVPGPNGAPSTVPSEERLVAMLAQAPSLGEDRIPGAYIDRITSGEREGGDSLHLLVMDLHKELNRLQQRLATETIDGACVYSIRDEDRPLIAAFMAGVNRTRELKFDHPGLGTTATRSGDRLVLQNDIGITDAHVLVVHVEGLRVTLIYTDVHIERLVFFQNLFERFAVTWEDMVSRRGAGLREDLYHLCTGVFVAQDHTDLLPYLTFLGSRLVFLIDWNRARKRLRKFAPRRVCLEALRWAADHDYGHRGFLTLGGEQLVFDALQAVGRVPLPPGVMLSDFLGEERTAEFLRFTLQTTSAGLRAGRSELLIRDEISAELRHAIDTAYQGLLGVAAEHASFVVELAMAGRDTLLALGPSLDRDWLRRCVSRAKKWEHQADELVRRGREARGRGDESGPILDLLATADDACDELEEAVHWTSLLADAGPGDAAPGLQGLADLLVQGAQEYLKAVENARCLHRGSPRVRVADFLEAVDHVITMEHQSDDAHRAVQAGVLPFEGDFKQWYLVDGVSERFEEAADALMRSALVLRDFILHEVLRR